MASHSEFGVRPTWGLTMLPVLAGFFRMLPAIAGTVRGWVGVAKDSHQCGHSARRGTGDLRRVALSGAVSVRSLHAADRTANAGPFLNKGATANAGAGERGYEFVFHIKNIPANATLRATDIRIGFGFGEWETVFETGQSGSGGTSRTHESVMWNLGWTAPLETKDGEIVTTWSATQNPDWETRVIAVKNDGAEVTTGNRDSVNDQTTWKFRDLPVRDVKSFNFQVRRVQWVEFRGIKLAPVPLEK